MNWIISRGIDERQGKGKPEDSWLKERVWEYLTSKRIWVQLGIREIWKIKNESRWLLYCHVKDQRKHRGEWPKWDHSKVQHTGRYIKSVKGTLSWKWMKDSNFSRRIRRIKEVVRESKVWISWWYDLKTNWWSWKELSCSWTQIWVK